MTFDKSRHDLEPIRKKKHSRYWRASIFASCLRASWSKNPQKERMDRYRSSIIYEGCEAISDRDVILVACDTVYFWDYAIPFLRTLAALGEPLHVHLHLIAPSDDVIDAIATLRQELASLHISYGIDRLDGLDLPKRLNIYYNCARFIVADHLFDRGVRRLLILDVDTIARSSPWDKLETVTSEGAFNFRPDTRKDWQKILAGTVYLTNTPTVKAFARRFAAALLTVLAKSPAYHIDQIIPYYLLKIGGARLSGVFGSVPDDLMSLTYAPDAGLWMAKGHEKQKDAFQTQIEAINKVHQDSIVGQEASAKRDL